jgi:hypothetical protein
MELPMEIRTGSRLHSAVCATELIVVRAPAGEVMLECGGSVMLHDGEEATGHPAIDPEKSGGSVLGKRYADESGGLELLCTKAGAGTLTADGLDLTIKSTKPLPSSD